MVVVVVVYVLWGLLRCNEGGSVDCGGRGGDGRTGN